MGWGGSSPQTVVYNVNTTREQYLTLFSFPDHKHLITTNLYRSTTQQRRVFFQSCVCSYNTHPIRR